MMGETHIISEVVTIYRVRYHGPDGIRRYKSFNSRGKGINRIAWWIVFDKYGDSAIEDTGEEWLPGMPRFEPKYQPPFFCECERHMDVPDWAFCPLHNRDNGYFRRLHDRIVRWIDKGYMLPNLERGEVA